VNLTDGGNILGTVSQTLTVGNIAPDDAGTYSVVVTNIAGTATSGNALLVPIILPTITTDPVNQAVVAGTTVTFTTSATGTAPLSYQWRFNDTDISGANGTSYTRPNVQSADAGAYYVVVTNAAGGVVSDNAALTVNTPPTLSPIAPQTVPAGQTVTFTAQATDIDSGQSLTFALDGGAPSGASIGSATGVFSWPTTPADAGTTNSITVRVTDGGTPPLSDTKTFTVAVYFQPRIQSITATNGIVTLTWSALDGKSYRLQYKDNLSDSDWSNLEPDVTAVGASASMTNSPGSAPRFYRVQVLE
jgi:hypothetical protein